MFFYWYLLAGLASGIFGGMGMGGGTILIPILTIFLNVPQKIAQSANLFAFLPMSAISLRIHSDNQLLCPQNTLWIIIPALFFSVLGGLIATFLPPIPLRKAFGVFLIILSFFQFKAGFNLFKK